MGLVFNSRYFDCFENLKRRRKAPTMIVIHHTCTRSPADTRRVLKKKGYSTHFEVDKDGEIYKYADEMDICNHCGSCNCYAIGIDITHMSSADFSDKQFWAVCSLIDYLCEKWNIAREVHDKLDGIYTHRAVRDTVCPQNFPVDKLASFFCGDDDGEYSDDPKLEGLRGLAQREAHS